MTTTKNRPLADAAAQAAVDAAARELHLPTVREEAIRLAEVAVRERRTHLGYLGEVLAAEVDDRQARRRARRVAEAKFPRLKRLADFDTGASTIPPATLAHLTSGAYLDAGEPVVMLGDSGTGGDEASTAATTASWEWMSDSQFHETESVGRVKSHLPTRALSGPVARR